MLKANLNHTTTQWLWFLTLSYIMVMTLANWFDPRLIQLAGLTTDAGTLIFPLTFLLSDLITEVYGYKYARRAIWCGFLFNALFIVYSQIVIHMPSPDFQTNNAAFDKLLTMNIRIIFASAVSYLLSEPLNSFVMAKMKIKMAGRYLWLRFLSSTLIASVVDCTVFSLLAFYGVIPNTNLINLIISMFVVKMVVELACLPFSTYIAVRLKKIERLDIYDMDTDFNIFRLNVNYSAADNRFLVNS